MNDDDAFRILELHRRLTEERDTVKSLKAEIAKLREENAVWQHDYNMALVEIEKLRKTIDYLQAERLRLRLGIVDDEPVSKEEAKPC